MKLVLCNGYPSPYDIGDNRTADFQQDAPGNDLTIDDVLNLELKHTMTVTLMDEPHLLSKNSPAGHGGRNPPTPWKRH